MFYGRPFAPITGGALGPGALLGRAIHSCRRQIARWAKRTPLVYYTFQSLPKRYPPPFCWLEQFAMGRSAGWIAAGQAVQSALGTRRGYTNTPHRVITLGVDVDAYRPDRQAGTAIRRTLGWDEGGSPVVGFLGRFVPEKGLHLLTAALDAQRMPWRALFVGGGKLEGDLAPGPRNTPTSEPGS